MNEKVRLEDANKLKLLFMKEYEEYLKLINNVEPYYQKLRLNWSKFHLFYEPNKNYPSTYLKPKGKKKKKCYYCYKNIEDDLKIIKQKEKQNNCYYFKPHEKSYILYNLKEVTNSVELYLNIKIESMNKQKKNALTHINDFCKIEINKISFLIILCEIKLNNLLISQKNVNDNNKLDVKIVKSMIKCCKEIIYEITKKIIPLFLSFNIFSCPDYFNYDFKYFNNLIEIIAA